VISVVCVASVALSALQFIFKEQIHTMLSCCDAIAIQSNYLFNIRKTPTLYLWYLILFICEFVSFL